MQQKTAEKAAAENRELYSALAKSFPDKPVFRVHNGELPRSEIKYKAIDKANEYLKFLDKDAKNNVLDLDDLFSDYKA